MADLVADSEVSHTHTVALIEVASAYDKRKHSNYVVWMQKLIVQLYKL